MHSIRSRDQVANATAAVGHKIRNANIQFKFQSECSINIYKTKQKYVFMCKAIFVFFISDIIIAKECASQCHAMIFRKVPHLLQLNSNTTSEHLWETSYKCCLSDLNCSMFHAVAVVALVTISAFHNCNLTNLTKCLHAQLGLVP